MQVITHQLITFGCDHGELECAGRLVFMNVGESLLRALFLWEQALAVILYGFGKRDLKATIRGFIALAMATKERLPPTTSWNPTAPRGSHCILKLKIDVNVNAVYSPSMAKSRFLQHPCCKLLIINLVSGVITWNWYL